MIFLKFVFVFLKILCVNFFIVWVDVCFDILIVKIFFDNINLFLFLILNGELWFNYIGIFLFLNFGWCFSIYVIKIDFLCCVF